MVQVATGAVVVLTQGEQSRTKVTTFGTPVTLDRGVSAEVVKMTLVKLYQTANVGWDVEVTVEVATPRA